ncbi:hypothetical protein [Microcoleus sp. T3_A4]
MLCPLIFCWYEREAIAFCRFTVLYFLVIMNHDRHSDTSLGNLN